MSVEFLEKDDSELFCSCGYHARIKGSTFECPACGKSVQQFYRENNWVFNHGPLKMVLYQKKVDVKSHDSFHSTMTPLELTISNTPDADGNHITCVTGAKKEVEFSLVNHVKKVYENGSEISASKNHIASALAHISADDFPNTIFQAISNQKGMSAAWPTVSFFMDYPWVEKFYSFDPRLDIACIADSVESLGHVNESKPEKILGMPKSMYKTYVKNIKDFSNAGMNYRFIMDLVKKHGPQKAEHLLELSVQMAHVRNCRSIPFAWSRLLKMDDVRFDYDTLFQYLTDQIYTYQGINSPGEGCQLLEDYIKTCMQMHVSFEKYPRSLKLVHDLATKNYEVCLKEETERLFNEAIANPEYTQYEDDTEAEYVVIAPKSSNDLIQEGSELSHCVGSYVEKVASNKDKILFMRKRTNTDRSLVTLDIYDGALIQAAGYGNRSLDEHEAEFVKRWMKRKHLRDAMYLF